MGLRVPQYQMSFSKSQYTSLELAKIELGRAVPLKGATLLLKETETLWTVLFIADMDEREVKARLFAKGVRGDVRQLVVRKPTDE